MWLRKEDNSNTTPHEQVTRVPISSASFRADATLPAATRCAHCSGNVSNNRKTCGSIIECISSRRARAPGVEVKQRSHTLLQLGRTHCKEVSFVRMPSAKPTDLQYALADGPGHKGLFRELNPGPLAPEARIMPLDQTAN